MPLQDDRRLKLFRALEDNDNYYELPLELSQLAEELAKSMLIMLHTIPKTLLRSIILNTVSYDFSNRITAPSPYYSADGPGTYVAAMSIRGHNGEFVCVVEIEDLIQGLRKYCKVYIRQKVHHGSPSTPEDKGLDDSAHEVGATFGSRTSRAKDRPKFIKNDDAHQKVLWLWRAPRPACRPVAQQGLSRIAFQKQGPLMVGCSNQTDDRMPHHNPKGSSGLSLTTPTWELTLHLIKSRLGLDLVVTVRPVIRTWENNLLVTSEVLITDLAGSYVFQKGFNIIGAGSLAGDKQDDVPTDYVDYIAEQTARDPEDSLAQVKAELLSAEATKVRLEIARTEAKARFGHLRERRIALHNQLDMLEDVREIIRILMSQTLKRGGGKEPLDS
ncbi:hypothetical protein DL769_002673 [Monosporascus sp. CRB-8-3]|nr:hypothetical protein DL769_002673 [Monosporascus sp. CRB-8-3]